jgi:hypothetical protein
VMGIEPTWPALPCSPDQLLADVGDSACDWRVNIRRTCSPARAAPYLRTP